MVEFTKMHGLGNDFAIFDGVRQAINFNREDIQFIANRHIGVGADQIIVVKASQKENFDFHYIIYNQDGSEVGQCGNAARCLAIYLKQKGLSDKSINKVYTNTTELSLSLLEDDKVSVAMGVPKFSPKEIPMNVDKQELRYRYQYNADELQFSALSLGNPHAVFIVEDAQNFPVKEIGQKVESDTAMFPERVNVGFMQILNKDNIRLRVYERGAGETMACGSGACAAFVAGVRLGLLNHCVIAVLNGGEVKLQWQGEGAQVYMTGTATKVFDGTIEI